MVKVRSSRRVAGLRPGDYDHEIGLVNHDEAETASSNALTAAATSRRDSTTSQQVFLANSSPTGQRDSVISLGANEGANHSQRPDPGGNGDSLEPQESLPHPSMQPSIEIQAATPDIFSDPRHRIVPRRPRDTLETAIDIMYENERGGILCGVPLFSSQALGCLDPPAWTNAFHKSSPTNIHTAVVPDPSWEWIWPEWRINTQEGVDEGGWQYSFAFSKKFSWHSARWWNSFVRRRVWIRKRAKRKDREANSSGSLLTSDYFIVRPASSRINRGSAGSLASSRLHSKSSATNTSVEEDAPGFAEIEDIDTLMHVLRSSRIDRERREALKNYIDHAIDLSALEGEMHEIMSMFVFQASRRQLLGHLMRKYDDTVRKLEENGNGDNEELQGRKHALEAAVKHANEEVVRLAYWSDVKKMAERGELRISDDQVRGWYEEHPGLDRSGPMEPNRGKLPEPG